MTRRQILGLALSAPMLGAQQSFRFREYGRCLPDYLSALAADAYARRNQRIARLKTAAGIREYQAWARRTFIEIAGGLPERTPLNLRTVGAFERSAYRVEKLVYESRPGLFITANHYVPKNAQPPFPGVLFQMGHSADGKGYPSYQRCCQGLVQLGYLVLAFDPMGQGERTNYPASGGWLTRLRSPDNEHTQPGKQMLLLGDTATGMQLWDAIRSLDVLASHPQVDARRLASTGQSGGGTLTMMLAAADDRLAAAAVCSGNTENVAIQPFLSPGSTDDAEQDLIGSGPLAFDRWDLLWPIAPRPLLVASSAHDFVGTYSPNYENSGREEFAKLSRAYATLGSPDHLRYHETPLPHNLAFELRLEVYNWFERYLKNSDRLIAEEPPVNPETDGTLWCGKTGNTVRDFDGKTPFILLREHARAIQTPDKAADLRKLLGMEPSPSVRLEVVARTRYANCGVLAIEVNSAPKVWAPAWVFLPKQSWTRLLLVFEPGGRNARWHEDELYAMLAASGVAVCAADVRGLGDMQPYFTPSGGLGWTRNHQSEENYAWSSLILGASLLGQRAADIIAFTEALAKAYPQAEIAVAALDHLTVPALCAAALEPRIGKLYLARHLASWRSIVQSENYSAPLANFVPGVLGATDLPQIARSIAPRPVIIAPHSDNEWSFETLAKLLASS